MQLCGDLHLHTTGGGVQYLGSRMCRFCCAEAAALGVLVLGVEGLSKKMVCVPGCLLWCIPGDSQVRFPLLLFGAGY